MKVSDALELVALVVDRWPRADTTDESLQRYAEDLAASGIPSEVLLAAIDAVHRDGSRFRPTAGEVIRRAATLELAPPEWVEVRRQLVQRRAAQRKHNPPPWTCPDDECDGSGYVVPETGPGESMPRAERCSCWDRRIAARKLADTLHPLVREFVREGYASWAEVDKIGEGAGDKHAVTLEAQVRNKWEAFAGRAVESRTLATIDHAPELARLEQARDEDAPRRTQERGRIGRPDFAGALPSGTE